MELEVKATIVVDPEETKGVYPQQITYLITSSIEEALEKLGFCRSCLITIKPVTKK